MSLIVSGMNHRTSDLALRERVVFAEAALPKALKALRTNVEDAGVVILSTCNRSEVYLNHAGDAPYLHHEVRKFLGAWHGIPDTELAPALYEYEGRETVGHLFRVTASLDSLVIGEQQILGQVHNAYLLAHQEQATDKVINALFQKAFTTAKRVRTQTSIGEGKVSVSSVAVDLAVSIFTDLSGATVLVLGSGEMSEQTLQHLVQQGVGKVIVANRTVENARALAERFGGEAISLEALDARLPEADIVISSTGAPGLLIHAHQLQDALWKRSQKPMFLIDIAVPRDIDAAANQLDNVYLYTMDDLQGVAERNVEARREAIERGLELVDAGVEQFWRWLRGLAAEPTIVSLSREMDAIRERELHKTLGNLQGLTPAQKEEIEYLTKRIVSNILQRPLAQIKQEAHEEEHGSVLQAVRRLFGLKEGGA
jgi:glutamyl-tRNA reductase